MNNNRGQKAKHTLIRRLQALRLVRYRQIVRTIPKLSTPSQHLRYRIYVAMAVDLLGKRALARVVWPWLKPSEPQRPAHYRHGQWRRFRLSQVVRTPRGRLSNPTALP
jgi:hypothetical protein